ncbi:MAG: flagellar hook-associated protein FlgK, partial [Phycisphaerae bacterium]|nr:flagellar hook-associated protein FlgK [Phycisphaerae bacterium]
GLNVVQSAIELVGTNLSNAGSEGYHRQDPIIRPLCLNTYGVVSIGGAEITEVRRMINNLLEMEIVRQQSSLGQASQELTTLETIESVFGELDSDGMDVAISHFFDSLTELTSQPDSQALREQVVWAADGLAGQFRNIGRFIDDVMEQVHLQAQQYVEQVNSLTNEISDLNGQITAVSLRGGSANMLQDRRDQAIKELADLINVEVTGGVGLAETTTISANGMQVVTGTSVMTLELQTTSDGKIGVSPEDSPTCYTSLGGGRLAGLLALNNDILADIRSSLDTLARQIITEVNQLHVQGVGKNGSFDDLTGVSVSSETLDEWSLDVEAGSFFIRVIDTNTQSVTRHEITVDPATDTVATIQADLDALGNISASIVGSALHIEADAGYQFDFLPAVSSQPLNDNITGSAEATISGIYEGDENQVFTCLVSGSGDVGIDEGLVLEVRNGAGELVKTVNVGQGYAAGDLLDIGSGIYVTMSTGSLADTDNFTIQALARTDTSGFLAAAGINTLFSGSGASGMTVREEILNNPGNLAGDVSTTGGDGINILKMSDIAGNTFAVLGDTSPQDYYGQIVTGVGQAIVVRQARVTSMENIMRQLGTQREDISGVDLNDEAAKLIVLERMYQAISKSISTQNKMLQFLFDII